jgi:hypothetical protein
VNPVPQGLTVHTARLSGVLAAKAVQHHGDCKHTSRLSVVR